MTERAPAHDYGLCGWRTASALDLAELPAWSGGDRQVDIEIGYGAVPDRLDRIALETPVLQVDKAGTGRFRVTGVGAYLVEDGRRITIAPDPGAKPSDVRLFLLGTPFGLLCHQRGLTPLHAATVEIDGGAVLLAGPSGIGKSTLAHAFLSRGFPLLGDDVAPIRVTDGGALALPALRRVRLWQDSAEAAGLDIATMDRCREGLQKFSRAGLDGFASHPLPVRALIHLQRMPQSAGDASFRRLRGHDAIEWAKVQVYRARSLTGVVGENEAFVRIARVAAAIPNHLVFLRPLRFEDLDRQIDMIVETVRAAR